MEDMKEKKREIRNNMAMQLNACSEGELQEKNREIEDRLFEFANFLEAKITLFYIDQGSQVATKNLIKKSYQYSKIVALPAFDTQTREMKLLKVDNLGKDLVPGSRGILEPNPDRCKLIPIDFIDIAIIPGVAFDEKGGRLGTGEGYYERLIPRLPITTRKVSLAFERQLVQQVPMESNDRFVDIIITEDRIIYKI
ncbi:5-formyltetrahydrofolate cyclo-ligase [Thermodesulfobacteriota bacterium]